MTGALDFWFEFASTYSYPAVMRIERVAAEKRVAVRWRPLLLGPLFHEQQGMKDSPFNVVPVKGAYMWRDVERVCEAEGLPFRKPSVFPRNGLHAARAVLACEAKGLSPGPFVRAVYTANFAADADISDVSVLGEILQEIDYDGGGVLALAATEEIKAQLKANVAEAKQRGLFGAPSFTTADGELFWGHDRMRQAVDWAAGLPPARREGGAA